MSLATILGIILGATAALVSVIVCLAYPMACKALESHLASPRPDFHEDDKGSTLWQQRRWALDKYRLRIAMIGLSAYAVGMILVTTLLAGLRSDGQSHPFVFACMLLTTASMLLMSIRSTIHNGRCSDLDMKRQYPDLYK